MRAFEIHIYQGGRWNIDSIFDDRGLAMHEAQRMDRSGRYVGIRVVEEVFNEDTEETSSRTIFRGTRVDQANTEHLERRKETRNEAMADRRRRKTEQVTTRKKKARAAKQKKSNPVRLIVMFALLAALAIGGLIGLQYLQATM